MCSPQCQDLPGIQQIGQFQHASTHRRATDLNGANRRKTPSPVDNGIAYRGRCRRIAIPSPKRMRLRANTVHYTIACRHRQIAVSGTSRCRAPLPSTAGAHGGRSCSCTIAVHRCTDTNAHGAAEDSAPVDASRGAFRHYKQSGTSARMHCRVSERGFATIRHPSLVTLHNLASRNSMQGRPIMQPCEAEQQAAARFRTIAAQAYQAYQCIASKTGRATAQSPHVPFVSPVVPHPMLLILPDSHRCGIRRNRSQAARLRHRAP